MNRNPVDGQSPPRNVVPGLIPVERVLRRTNGAVLWVPVIRVFPNGVVCDLELVHTPVPDQDQRRLILRECAVQLTVDAVDARVMLENSLVRVTEPFPLLFWKRSSGTNGVVAAVWIGRIPERHISIESAAENTDGQRLHISRDDIDSAAGRIIKVGDDSHPDNNPGIVFLD